MVDIFHRNSLLRVQREDFGLVDVEKPGIKGQRILGKEVSTLDGKLDRRVSMLNACLIGGRSSVGKQTVPPCSGSG